jgi:hypothetical protein
MNSILTHPIVGDEVQGDASGDQTGPIIQDWQKHHPSLFGEHILHLRHRLATSELFSDEGLARLIEATPVEHCYVNTMDRRSHNPRSRREGAIGELSGAEALEAVKRGNIWINIHKLTQTDARYQSLLDEIFREFEDKVPGLKTYKHSMTLLISSPKVQVYYHCDVPGQMLWQMRGKKRVFVYPNKAPFLTQPAMEKIVLGEAHETVMPYEPWFDDYAEAIDLEAGEMLHWPLNCPHRVMNHDCLNVSMTTEHWTDALRDVYAVNYANGVLRRVLHAKTLSRNTSGAGYWAKAGLTAAMKATGLQARHQRKRLIDFAVDPKAADGVRDIPAYAFGR